MEGENLSQLRAWELAAPKLQPAPRLVKQERWLFKHMFQISSITPLGQGRNATIRLCKRRGNVVRTYRTHEHYEKKYAAKIYTEAGYKNARREAYVAQKVLGHPHLLGLIDVFINSHEHILVFEYAWRGTLHDHVSRQRRLTEFEAHKAVRHVALALNFLHGLGILHRDVKPANVFLFEVGHKRALTFKLGDFDTATGQVMDELGRTWLNPMFSDLVGTVGYMAPEIAYRLAKTCRSTGPPRYNFKCDVWSLGIMAYRLIRGKLPFMISCSICNNQLACDLCIHKIKTHLEKPDVFSDLERLAKALLLDMLVINPQNRIAIDGVLRSAYIQNPPRLTLQEMLLY